MFTGIVTDVGTVLELKGNRDKLVRIAAPQAGEGIEPGASVACDGVCLTATRCGTGACCWFEADVSAETLARTNIRCWKTGHRVNLERPLKVGDELGGHIVTGHVDDIAEVTAMTDVGDSRRVQLRVPEALSGLIAPKGSVALNGVSLTVNGVDGREFDVNLIPFTLSATNLAEAREGAWINVEVDILARYVARLNAER